MADLSTTQAAQPVIIIGADINGVETYPADIDSLGRFKISPLSINDAPTFNVISSATAFGNNKSMIALYNGSSTNVLKIQAVRMLNIQTANVTGVVADLRALRITGLTGGTALTPQTHDTNDTISAGVIAATGGTVSGEAANFLFRKLLSTDEWGSNTADTEAFQSIIHGVFPLWSATQYTKPIYIRPNQGIHIKCATNTAVSALDLEILFTQE